MHFPPDQSCITPFYEGLDRCGINCFCLLTPTLCHHRLHFEKYQAESCLILVSEGGNCAGFSDYLKTRTSVGPPISRFSVSLSPSRVFFHGKKFEFVLLYSSTLGFNVPSTIADVIQGMLNSFIHINNVTRSRKWLMLGYRWAPNLNLFTTSFTWAENKKNKRTFIKGHWPTVAPYTLYIATYSHYMTGYIVN